MKCVRILRLESRKASINNQNLDLSVNRQLKLLQVPHSSFYYKSRREIFRTASDEQLKNEMMEIYYGDAILRSSPFDCGIETPRVQSES